MNLLKRRLTVAETLSEVGGHLVWGTPKNHQARSVPIPNFLVDHAGRADRRQGMPMILSSRRGAASRCGISTSAVTCSTEPPTMPVSHGLTPHELRHTAASLAVSAGANVKAVQRMLGHASAAMTLDVYSGLFDDDLDGVAARLDPGVPPDCHPRAPWGGDRAET